jgi:hypothetical protein
VTYARRQLVGRLPNQLDATVGICAADLFSELLTEVFHPWSFRATRRSSSRLRQAVYSAVVVTLARGTATGARQR